MRLAAALLALDLEAGTEIYMDRQPVFSPDAGTVYRMGAYLVIKITSYSNGENTITIKNADKTGYERLKGADATQDSIQHLFETSTGSCLFGLYYGSGIGNTEDDALFVVSEKRLITGREIREFLKNGNVCPE